jgi:hypothetical protein
MHATAGRQPTAGAVITPVTACTQTHRGHMSHMLSAMEELAVVQQCAGSMFLYPLCKHKLRTYPCCTAVHKLLVVKQVVSPASPVPPNSLLRPCTAESRKSQQAAAVEQSAARHGMDATLMQGCWSSRDDHARSCSTACFYDRSA